ncbi:hypothetical protein [Prosthecobacter dejongeii]|uniref:Glycerol-3-phosphate dehydrogenase n=1 Tax=Prosthecobacter dejongeii TaxID=48465 RepID=A0A7W7YPT3_9BACT|nr:hypothetical protein [Prosthecobacter dejongeii]MBB5040148.1 glycerol-3-phosphate dehydrogenase [Prosthecobacter dejongeii]
MMMLKTYFKHGGFWSYLKLMSTNYDVIVIGGGPEGDRSTAIFAGAGLRLVLLERKQFPRHHIGVSLIHLGASSSKDSG